MLTPLDIHNKEFKKGFRGYEVNEVDEFLDDVIKDFETLYKENLELKEQLQKQKDNLNRYKEMEETLQNTMVLAQKLAEESRRNSEKEAELVIWEAKKKAEQIVGAAYDQISECTRKAEQIHAFEKQVKVRLMSFLRSQLELLNEEKTEDLPLVIGHPEEIKAHELVEDSGA